LKGNNLAEELRDSSVLCQLIETLYPERYLLHNLTQDIDIPDIIILENIGIIIDACKENGVSQEELFKVYDLFEGHDLRQVCICLLSLKTLEEQKKKGKEERLKKEGHHIIKKVIGGREENIKKLKKTYPYSWWTVASFPVVVLLRFPLVDFVIQPFIFGMSIGVGVKFGHRFFNEEHFKHFFP